MKRSNRPYWGVCAALLLALACAALTVGGAPSHLAGGRPARQARTAELPCPIDADLWLMGGQSNMDGQDYAANYPTRRDPKIVAFDMSNRWVVAQEPITRIFEAAAPVHQRLVMQWMRSASPSDEAARKLFDAFRADLRNRPRGVGPGLAFAQAVRKATGRPIGLIPCSHGGTSMEQWDPALKDQGDDSLYGALLHRVAMMGARGKVKGLLWYQGESDVVSPDTIGKFEQRFIILVEALRRDLGEPGLPVLYVQIGRWVRDDPVLARGYEQIREHQRLLASKLRNSWFTTAIDQPLYDPIHVSGAGEQRLGRRLAELALTHVYNRPGHGQQIDLESVTVPNPTTIRVRFKGVTGKLQAPVLPAGFELRDPSPAYKEKPLVFRVGFDPKEPACVDLAVSTPLVGPVKLICGPGIAPAMNIVDDRGMPIPAFGPVEVPVAAN